MEMDSGASSPSKIMVSTVEFVLNAWSPTFFTDLGRIISFNFLQPTKVHP